MKSKIQREMEEFRKKFQARVFGRFVFTTVTNGVGAPFIDKCVGQTDQKQSWRGWAIQKNPFNFRSDGRRKEGECFVVGIIQG